jgi:HK97 family phage major capsid protein
MKTSRLHLLNVLLFAAFGAILFGVAIPFQAAPLVGAVVFQALHFASIPYGVAGDLALGTLKGVKDQMGVIHRKMDDIMKKVATEKRNDLTTEEETEYTRLETEFEGLKKHRTRLESQEERNRTMSTPTDTTIQDEIPDKEKRDFSKFRLLRGLGLLAAGKPLDGIEKEVHDMTSAAARANGITIEGFAVPSSLPGTEKRDQTVTLQTTNPGDQGGVLVATEVGGLIDALWAKNFLSLVGARRLNGLVGNQSFPTVTTKPVAEAVTEIQQLTAQTILFGKVDMAPNRRGATIPVSKQLILQSSIDIEKLVMDLIRKCLDLRLNQDAMTALLAAITAPNGNLLALGTNGATPTYLNMVALETMVAGNDADKDSMKYLLNSKGRGYLKGQQKFSSTNGDPIYEKGNEINGYPAVVSNVVPSNLVKGSASNASAIVFGDFSQLYVGMWGGADFVVDPYTLADKGEVKITANMYWDVEVAQALSFAGIKDALTA